MKSFAIIFGLFLCLLFTNYETALAQDPTVVDAKHYQMVFENDQVRVLRITYGPGEKSAMHEHPDGVVVFLTDHAVNFTLPNGEVINSTGKKGDSGWAPGGKHLPQNVGDQPMEAILVELKNQPEVKQK